MAATDDAGGELQIEGDCASLEGTKASTTAAVARAAAAAASWIFIVSKIISLLVGEGALYERCNPQPEFLLTTLQIQNGNSIWIG